MPCSRNGCDNILCDTYINNHGYICNNCLSELIQLNSGKQHTKSEWDEVISNFMKTNQKKEDKTILSLDDFIENEY